jgi:hypothetical protein
VLYREPSSLEKNVEYIVLTSSSGIAINGLLGLFANTRDQTLFVAWEEHSRPETITDVGQTSAACVVFYGEYNTEHLKHIHSLHPTAKNIFLFDTAESALLQNFNQQNSMVAIENGIKTWSDSIARLTQLAERNPGRSVLVDYASLLHKPEQIIAQINSRLSLQLTHCILAATSYSSIARLIAAALLIDQDEAMILYDDAKTLALTDHSQAGYTDASTLAAKHHSTALAEFQQLLAQLKIPATANNTATAAEKLQHQLAIAQQTSDQLREEVTTLKRDLSAKERELGALANTRQQLSNTENELAIVSLHSQHLQEELAILGKTREQLLNKENELAITLLQLQHMQEELEHTLEKYEGFERHTSSTLLMEKIVREIPLMGLLRHQAISAPPTN